VAFDLGKMDFGSVPEYLPAAAFFLALLVYYGDRRKDANRRQEESEKRIKDAQEAEMKRQAEAAMVSASIYVSLDFHRSAFRFGARDPADVWVTVSNYSSSPAFNVTLAAQHPGITEPFKTTWLELAPLETKKWNWVNRGELLIRPRPKADEIPWKLEATNVYGQRWLRTSDGYVSEIIGPGDADSR
jgi:hypothetical protein